MNQRRECGRHTFINATLAQQILQLATEAEASDVSRTPRCTLEGHLNDTHRALVMQLDRGTDGAAWVQWDNEPPNVVAILPDCDNFNPQGSACCCLFHGHPGGHTWELEEPT